MSDIIGESRRVASAVNTTVVDGTTTVIAVASEGANSFEIKNDDGIVYSQPAGTATGDLHFVVNKLIVNCATAGSVVFTSSTKPAI